MPYRPSFDDPFPWPPIAALLPATGYASVVVAPVLFVIYHVTTLIFGDVTGSADAIGAAGIGWAVIGNLLFLVGIAMFVFIVSGLSFLFVGVPLAWVLGNRIRHRLAIIPTLLAAGILFLTVFGWPFVLSVRDSSALLFVLPGLLGALMAAMIYRHSVIAFRDENELLD